jgi:hypothetical protein
MLEGQQNKHNFCAGRRDTYKIPAFFVGYAADLVGRGG